MGFKFKTEAEAIAAVKENSDALRYVKEQTEAVCLAAVKEYGDALRYVKELIKAFDQVIEQARGECVDRQHGVISAEDEAWQTLEKFNG